MGRCPSGRAFGCAGTTPAACFRHSASIANARRQRLRPSRANAPSSRSSLRGLSSITCFRLMRRHAIPASTARQRKALDARSPARPSRSHRVSRAVFFGIANDGITKVRRQRPTLSPRKPVSENPAIEGQAVWEPTRCCRRLLRNAVVSCRIPDNFHLRRPPAASNGLGLTEDRLRLDRLPATAAASFFPPRVRALCIAKQKSRRRPSSAGAAALRVRADRPRSNDHHRGRDWRGPRTNGDTTMATIGTFTKTENGYHRHGQDPDASTSRPKFVPTGGRQRARPRLSASSPVPPSSAQPGRRPPARRGASISRSSWTIRASRRRSTPAWSRPRTARATTSSGPAATAIEARPTKEPRSRAGLRRVHGRAADQEYGDQDGRMSGFAACTS